LIKNKYGLDATAVGDEGGFAPNFQSNKVWTRFLKPDDFLISEKTDNCVLASHAKNYIRALELCNIDPLMIWSA
jgi:hypothetical protein